MTVNERLFEAGLLEQFQRAQMQGDRIEINSILAKVDLWQDANGMNWDKLRNARNR
ncbi:MAG: hypothetical protein R3E09_01585 [Novosphingobium sp.]